MKGSHFLFWSNSSISLTYVGPNAPLRLYQPIFRDRSTILCFWSLRTNNDGTGVGGLGVGGGGVPADAAQCGILWHLAVYFGSMVQWLEKCSCLGGRMVKASNRVIYPRDTILAARARCDYRTIALWGQQDSD